jgi:predicted Rossmann fold nucleotide-binding protein DprA/Smf involved in DNA uptake
MTDATIAQLTELRDHHERELRRCNDALELLRQVSQLSKRAAKMTGTAAATSAKATGRDHKAERARAVNAKARTDYQKRHSGTRPIDALRQLFAAAGSATVTPEFIHQQTGLAVMPAALALSWMKRKGEVKRTAAGWVVKKLNLPANGNGAHA